MSILFKEDSLSRVNQGTSAMSGTDREIGHVETVLWEHVLKEVWQTTPSDAVIWGDSNIFPVQWNQNVQLLFFPS